MKASKHEAIGTIIGALVTIFWSIFCLRKLYGYCGQADWPWIFFWALLLCFAEAGTITVTLKTAIEGRE